MRNFLALFFLIPFFSFAVSDMTYLNMDSAWAKFNNGQTQEGIEILDNLLTDINTDKLEKVHYLNAKAMINFSADNKKEYQECWEELKSLCLCDPECDLEMWRYYEFSFFYSGIQPCRN